MCRRCAATLCQRVVEEGRNVANRVDRDEVDEKIAWLDAQTAPPEEPDWVTLPWTTRLHGSSGLGWEQFLHQCDVLPDRAATRP